MQKSMKHVKNLILVMFAIFCCTAFTSCDKDDDKEPSTTTGRVNITNKSQYTLYDFGVVFTNSKGEKITAEDKGTLKPNDKVTVDIPIGATYYYMRTYLSGKYYFSVDYSTDVRSQVLSDQVVGNWTSN